MSESSAAFPIAPADMQQEILDLVQQASHYRQLSTFFFFSEAHFPWRTAREDEGIALAASQTGN